MSGAECLFSQPRIQRGQPGSKMNEGDLCRPRSDVRFGSFATDAIRATMTAAPITSAGRFSPLGPRGISRLLATQFQLFFVENMEHTRKCGMIRLDDITDGSRSVCENRDNKAGILIAASLP